MLSDKEAEFGPLTQMQLLTQTQQELHLPESSQDVVGAEVVKDGVVESPHLLDPDVANATRLLEQIPDVSAIGSPRDDNANNPTTHVKEKLMEAVPSTAAPPVEDMP